MKRLNVAFGFLILLAAVVFLTRAGAGTPGTSDHGIQVTASFYPLAEFTQAVGGDLVNVVTITPGGVEPHEYQPTAEQLTQIYRSDILFSNGGGIDAWADRIAPDLTVEGIPTIPMTKLMTIDNDPHLWLDPVIAGQEIDLIQAALTALDPDHGEMYASNANVYQQKLAALNRAYRQGLENCTKRTVVTAHNALGYLAQQYDFNVLPIAGLSPEEEPSAGRLAEIATLARAQQIKYIYFETLVSPKLAETLATEIGATTLVFNPIEGLSDEDAAAGKNYLSLMQDNLRNLQIGMLCQ